MPVQGKEPYLPAAGSLNSNNGSFPLNVSNIFLNF